MSLSASSWRLGRLSMVWIPDILIEYRGMSIVTALFFSGVGLIIGGLWQYTKYRFNQIKERMDEGKAKFENTCSDITEIKVELAIVRTTVEKMDKAIDRMLDRCEE